MAAEQSENKPIKIAVRDLWKSYGNQKVLKGLNLNVFDGETLVILGRSGVGKSVLLRHILGIELPDSGYIDIDGKRLSSMSQNQRLLSVKKMGMLFQGSALFDSMNVKENIAFYLRQHERLSEKEIDDLVNEALSMVGLAKTKSTMPSELSGGMRKRAALARLIVYKPEIVLYDEPTTGLDPITAQQINELINKTKRQLKSTSIVVTHDIRSALKVGDRVAFHDEGRITQIADKEAFLKIQDPHLQAFFENAFVTPSMFEKG